MQTLELADKVWALAEKNDLDAKRPELYARVFAEILQCFVKNLPQQEKITLVVLVTEMSEILYAEQIRGNALQIERKLQ
jgi:hypothetical protein